MTQIRIALSMCGVLISAVSVFAFPMDDEYPCIVPFSIGYHTPYTPDGVPPDPNSVYRIINVYTHFGFPGSYNCVASPEICRYVYDEFEGKWFSCTGRRTYFPVQQQ